MTHRLKATEACAETDGTVCVIGWMADAQPDPEYVQLQYNFDPDEQDIELGMDTIYLEVNDQYWSLYGGIDHVRIEDSRIVMTLNQAGRDRLGIDDTIEIICEGDVSNYIESVRGLQNMLSSQTIPCENCMTSIRNCSG